MGEEAKQVQAEEAVVKEEEKKEEDQEKKEDQKAEEEKKEEAKPPSPFVLFVDLHCVGCAKKIERSILKIRGVEGVTMDMVKGDKGVVEPQAVCSRIMNKTKRIAKVLSPLPEAEGAPMPQVVASQVSGLTTIQLNVNMHCEACAAQLKKKILKMKGVRTVETELSSSKVTVTGTMDADRLVDYVYRRTKKQAKVVPQPEPEKPPEETPKPEEKKEEETAAAGGEEAKPEEEKKEEGEREARRKKRKREAGRRSKAERRKRRGRRR
ncbi:Heavy metal-associated isoprenylated plant protein 9 [Sesamum angolense]|uniref:Heavy metal-associated isoprenylated plant protein 9 n=1 Tax=Sesamum angolense TaxID=2727404 RepID=A0AAE1TC86_9LAMI|nr:Heavy metal-associated isoprenylated plant protein 9 [Sesamum angolense]